MTVDGFWIDATPVTNAQFRRFVEATGHVTWAEIPPDPKDYPGAKPNMLKAGGLVFTALQDGWIVAYNNDTLEELWRFNVGTALKGAPVTYAIGPKQYLAVQSSGRHLHPHVEASPGNGASALPGAILPCALSLLAGQASCTIAINANVPALLDLLGISRVEAA